MKIGFATYRNLVNDIQIGKRLPNALYLHQCALNLIPAALIDGLNQTIHDLGLENFDYTLIKFFTRDFKLSLLDYPDFFEHPYPALHTSCAIDLALGKYRIVHYGTSNNPPILHRKETFLPPDHPLVSQFSQQTMEAEQAGLFGNPHRIGFKQSWEKLIEQQGYQLQEGHLIAGANQPTLNNSQSPNGNLQFPTAGSQFQHLRSKFPIQRYRTALNRHAFSTPMQSLYDHGYLNGEYSLFDYGCGKGDDLRELQMHGIEAKGWDPVYAPNNPKCKADIVNLGFVINVIENPYERKACLLSAYELCQLMLVVAVILGSSTLQKKFQPYGDGVITRHNTFQKYYRQWELKKYLESVLETHAIAVGPGLFYIFRDSIKKQLFLSSRQRPSPQWQPQLAYPSSFLSQKRDKAYQYKQQLFNRHQALLENFWTYCWNLGRPPMPDEFDLSDQITAIFGSPQKAFGFLYHYYGDEVFQAAKQAAQINDLLVYLALNLFSEKPYTHCPSCIQPSVKAFFGDYVTAIATATDLLFSASKPEVIYNACVKVITRQGISYLEKEYLQLHTSLLSQLPAVLCVYISCAIQLYGDLEQVDLVKIHIRSGKVTLMIYDDFMGKPLPELKQRIKIQLQTQDIAIDDYNDEYSKPLLYLKSRYLTSDFPCYEEQCRFDATLEKLGLFDLSGYGPSQQNFYNTLAEQHYEVQGFQLIKRLF